MTEEEAKNKWCPISFAGGEPAMVPCCASECMWWVADKGRAGVGYCGHIAGAMKA